MFMSIFFHKNNMSSFLYNFIVIIMMLSIISDVTKYAVFADDCKESIIKLGFNGQYMHDSVYCTNELDNEDYVKFLNYVDKKKMGKLPPYEIDLIYTFCSITEYFRSQHFTGNRGDDMNKISTIMNQIDEDKKNGSYYNENKAEQFVEIEKYYSHLKFYDETLFRLNNIITGKKPNEALNVEDHYSQYQNQQKIYNGLVKMRDDYQKEHEAKDFNFVITYAASIWLKKSIGYVSGTLVPAGFCEDSKDVIIANYEECEKYAKTKDTEIHNFRKIYCFHSDLLYRNDFNGIYSHDKELTPRHKDLLSFELNSYSNFLAQFTTETPSDERNLLCEYAVDILLKRIETKNIRENSLNKCRDVLNEFGFKGTYEQDKDKSSTDNQKSYGLVKGYLLLINYLKETNSKKSTDTDTYELFCDGANLLERHGYKGIRWYDACYSPSKMKYYGAGESYEADSKKEIDKIAKNESLMKLFSEYQNFVKETKEEPNLVYRFFVNKLSKTVS